MSIAVHDASFLAALSTIIAAIYAVLHGLRVLRKSAASKLRGSLPPGPVGLPIVGEWCFIKFYTRSSIDDLSQAASRSLQDILSLR